MDATRQLYLRSKADWLTYRWLMRELWYDRLRHSFDPNGEISEIGSRSINQLEAFCEKIIDSDGGADVLQFAVGEMESFWRDLATIFPPGSRPPTIPHDDDDIDEIEAEETAKATLLARAIGALDRAGLLGDEERARWSAAADAAEQSVRGTAAHCRRIFEEVTGKPLR